MVSVLVLCVICVAQFTRLVFSEPVKGPEHIPYSLKYVDEDFFNAITDNETLMSKGKVVTNGDTKCYYGNSPVELAIVDEDELSEIVEVINRNLVGCHSNNGIMWIYNLCSEEVRYTYHYYDYSMKYIMGQSANYNSTSDYTYHSSNDSMPYIKQILDNGTICDLTGKPRQTEVRYYCEYEAFPPVRFHSDEVQTCEYVEKVYIPELCRFKSMNNLVEEFSEYRIYCHKAENTTPSIIRLLNDYSFQKCPKNIFLLTPNDRSIDRPVVMYRTDITDGNTKDATVLTVEERFIEEIVGNIEHLLKIKFIRTPKGEAIQSGDVFLWRAPVVDLDGQLLFLIDLEFNGTSQVIARINYETSLLNDLPLHNMVRFSPAFGPETTENPAYGPSKVYDIFQHPDKHPSENIEEDLTKKKITDAFARAFADAGLEGFNFEVIEAEIN